MNITYKKMHALIFSLVMVAPMYGMENNTPDAASDSTVWYKKPSVQVAAVVTAAAAGLAFAFRRTKIAIPAFVTALFVATKEVEADDEKKVDQAHGAQPADVSIYSTDEMTIEEVVTLAKRKLEGTWKTVSEKATTASKELSDLWKECKNGDFE